MDRPGHGTWQAGAAPPCMIGCAGVLGSEAISCLLSESSCLGRTVVKTGGM